MVIVRLMGGLGNQMFQYAAGRRIALAHNVPLELDVSWFARSPDRVYGLHALNISEAFATPDELREIRGPATKGIGRLAFRLRRLLRIGYRWRWIQERRLSPFDRRVREARGPTYLDGYWQSERYFSDIADTIRREFTIKVSPDPRSREIAAQIAATAATATTESVSVHVRRGDYVADPQKSQARNVCTPDYYERSVRRVAEACGNPHLFLFSDDPDWVARKLRFAHPTTLVRHGSDHEDLRLMSLCRHHIIANSSFSWWGAWLDPRPDKLMRAPRRWMNDPRVDDRDVVPPGWIRM